MTNIKKIELGVIGVLLAEVAALSDVSGTLTNQIDADTQISNITLTIASAPTAIKAGLWLTGNAGDFQRFDYNGVVDNTNGTYTFNFDRPVTVKSTVLSGTPGFVENNQFKVLQHGDNIESGDELFVQVQATNNAMEFPGISGDAAKLWHCEVNAAVVNRIGMDAEMAELSELYADVEAALNFITISNLALYSGVTINGFMPQQSEDGKWDDERQGKVASTEVKYTYE